MNPARPLRGARAGIPGVRRYRVWWLEGRAEVVAAPRMAANRQRRLRHACGGGFCMVAAAGLCALCGEELLALRVAGSLFVLLASAFARQRWIGDRPRRLRRRGARPGSWIWAIDAESAACTARIRAAVP